VLSDLTSIERSRLKDAFRAISDWQEMAAYHYRTEMF
jgi:CBS domain-containing protein